MSWEDIIKQPKREGWRERIKRKRGEKKYRPTPVEFTGGRERDEDSLIDLDEDEFTYGEICCEQAKNSLLGWVSSYEKDEATQEGLFQIIESESCDTIKETFSTLSGVNKNNELRQIMVDWEDCLGREN